MCVCVWATGKAFHIQLPEMLLAQNVGIINVAGMAFGEELALVIYMGRREKPAVCWQVPRRTLLHLLET